MDVPGKAPRVSVLLPVRDAAGTVVRAVSSIRAQTYADWELVVVDDGSEDGTLECLEALVREEGRIRLLRQGRMGIVAALNRACGEARGAWLARMDADDESLSERLAAQLEYGEQHADVGVVGTLVAFGGDAGEAGGYARHVTWLNGLIDPEAIALNRFIEAPLAHPSVMFRRECLDQHGGYRAGPFPEDYELWLRWLERGVRMAKVPRVLVRWHDPPGRLSRVDPRYDPEAFYRCKAGYLARWLARHVPSGRPVLVWGAGRPTRRRAEYLVAEGVRIAGYIDIDPRKIGRVYAGRRVNGPEALPPVGEAFVLGYVAKWEARELTRVRLAAAGYVEGRDFLMAA